MTIFEKIESILATVGIGGTAVPYWYSMPIFSGNSPKNYIVYDLYDFPCYQGDGKIQRKTYNVTVNVFGEDFGEINEKLESALIAEGFVYAGGGQIESGENYPYTLHHYKEFIINMEVSK